MNLRFYIDKTTCRKLRDVGTCHKNSKSGTYPCQEVGQEIGVSLIVETRMGDPYACMQCSHNPTALSPPCMFTERGRNASLDSLLNGKPTGIREVAPICPVDAIKTGDKGIWIEEEKCVGCLLCVAACPVSAIVVDQNLRAHLLSPHKSKNDWSNACPWGATSFKETSKEDIIEFQRLQAEKNRVRCRNSKLVEYLDEMHFGKVTFPTRSYVGPTEVSKTNFEEFSMSDEVTMLTPWIGETLKRISHEPVISAYEARLPSKPGLRYPRLDFCIVDKEAVLVIESKRDEGSARSGIVDQLRKKYREEIKTILGRRQVRRWNLLLATGGPESELRRSDYLFSLLSSNRIQLVSASFIWCLLAYNLFSGKRLPWSSVIPQVFSNPQVVAALANGVVIDHGTHKFELIPVARFFGGRR